MLGRAFAGRALAPITALNDQVDRITALDLHQRVDEGTLRTSERDDLTRLARTFNRLLARLDSGGTLLRGTWTQPGLRTPLVLRHGALPVAPASTITTLSRP